MTSFSSTSFVSHLVLIHLSNSHLQSQIFSFCINFPQSKSADDFPASPLSVSSFSYRGSSRYMYGMRWWEQKVNPEPLWGKNKPVASVTRRPARREVQIDWFYPRGWQISQDCPVVVQPAAPMSWSSGLFRRMLSGQGYQRTSKARFLPHWQCQTLKFLLEGLKSVNEMALILLWEPKLNTHLQCSFVAAFKGSFLLPQSWACAV